MNSIITKRLTIEPFTEHDAAFILELLNEPAFIANIGDRNVHALEDAREYIRKVQTSYAARDFGLYRVCLTSSREVIGMCGLIKRDSLEDIDIGYALLTRHWGNGYASEAVSAIMEDAKQRLSVARLVAIVDPKNQASLRVLEKAGFVYERMFTLPNETTELKLLGISL